MSKNVVPLIHVPDVRDCRLDKRRREVDLYIYTDDVDEVYERLKDRVDVIEGPHNTFYGMREVIIRDLNRFWITFAQEKP